jgi:DNA-binding MarR family transcriptional regulator
MPTRKEREALDFGDIPEHTGYHIRRAHSYFTRIFSSYGRRFGVRSQQATILTLASRNPGVSPARIADANDIERSLVAKLVAELEERGFIERRPSGRDRREKGLHVTRNGRAFLKEIMATFAREMEPLLVRNLSSTDKRALIRLLKKVYSD